ncbi:hypothetical protein [Salimicrobium flavidum]|uniref:Uncharacterized protein n=1 Tax=Salimicrobium flavidum TaxID=570947 RepID=A0A1N7J2K2_9BACI|nr:hypothetical protein [Salimicrobium flavidum]SIS43595.1 hypothetical protein SAMN05421687_103257 [Salimicrobium flavidum]
MREEAKQYITDCVVKEFYLNYPWLEEKFGEKGRKHTREDNEHHLRHLELAYELDDEKIFKDYSIWLNDVLVSRGVGTRLIIENYDMIQRYMQDVEIDQQERSFYTHVLETSISYLKQMTNTG